MQIITRIIRIIHIFWLLNLIICIDTTLCKYSTRISHMDSTQFAWYFTRIDLCMASTREYCIDIFLILLMLTQMTAKSNITEDLLKKHNKLTFSASSCYFKAIPIPGFQLSEFRSMKFHASISECFYIRTKSSNIAS